MEPRFRKRVSCVTPLFRTLTLCLFTMLACITYQTAQADNTGNLINYPAVTPLSQFTFNGDANAQGDGSLQLTSIYQSNNPNGQNYAPNALQTGSFYYNSRVNVSKFTTTFRFRLTPWAGRQPDDPWADGITFAIQNQGNGAGTLGGGGSYLGYADGSGTQPSVALKFKTFALGDPNNGGDPSISTVSMLTGGQDPTGSGLGLTDLLQYGEDFDIGQGAPFRADVTYGGAPLNLTLTNEATGKSISLKFAVNIPAYVGDNSAYVGFTCGTGLFVSDQRILSWQYSATGQANDPLRPTITSITPASVAVGSGTTQITINGAGFASASAVTLNNTPLSINFRSATQLVVVVPASLLTTPRVSNLIVAAGGRYSNAAPFTVTSNTPVSTARLEIDTSRNIFVSGIDAGGSLYVVFALRNTGGATITNVSLDNIQLDQGNGRVFGGFLEQVEAGGSPGASLASIPPNGFIRGRFVFHAYDVTLPHQGVVSIAGGSSQGRFNAGSHFVVFP